jgi:hypothetical protein
VQQGSKVEFTDCGQSAGSLHPHQRLVIGGW